MAVVCNRCRPPGKEKPVKGKLVFLQVRRNSRTISLIKFRSELEKLNMEKKMGHSKIWFKIFVSVVLVSINFSLRFARASDAPTSAKVFFVEPKDGAIVASPVHLVFGVTGMKVRVAGEDATDKTSGHHHLIIDGNLAPTGNIIPANSTNIHYGKGQTEDNVKLTPGKHKLTLQFADGAHRSYGESLSSSITVIVK